MTVADLVPDGIVYPDSDGKRMAENTKQYRWIVTIQGNLSAQYLDDPTVFVAGDNLIYPVKGKPKICTAPDVYVAFGRPKGDRGSYQVWKEDDIFPQVIFEVLSPGNRATEMTEKRAFYRKYGAEEYYVIDPDAGTVEAAVRRRYRLVDVDDIASFVSPRLGIRFDTSGEELIVLDPTGERFQTFDELAQEAGSQKRRANAEKRRADTLKRRVDNAEARAEALAAKLRALGINPDAIS